ncbi:ABC transporter permease [Deinococcus sp. KNUC1210]|uniref:ABC transporter permease n=1 Tax=Deinococcus sp. KNUC1210 TaxID=2917691 RepID=UPI001EF0CD2F|nr:ABC transporter permease [Deinococcus sp. KNUC1210]ULH16854.1 ABC transporter permease [Deinococcus sp. KNUC1210]
MNYRLKVVSIQLGGLLALLGLWWFFTDVRPIWPKYVLPDPGAVWTEMKFGLFGKSPDGKLTMSILNSLRRVAIGFLIAVGSGLVVGVILSVSKSLRDVVSGYLTAVQSVPSIAFVPLAILFFGLNERAVLAVVILEGFIPVALSVAGALGNVPPALRTAGRTLGAKGIGLVTRVMLPASLPNLVGGLRTAWSFSWRALIGAELLTTNPGLGQLLEIGRNTANVALVFTTIITVGVVGALFDVLIRSLESRIRYNYGLEGES